MTSSEARSVLSAVAAFLAEDLDGQLDLIAALDMACRPGSEVRAAAVDALSRAWLLHPAAQVRNPEECLRAVSQEISDDAVIVGVRRAARGAFPSPAPRPAGDGELLAARVQHPASSRRAHLRLLR